MKSIYIFIAVLLFPIALLAYPNGDDAPQNFSFTPPLLNTNGTPANDIGGFRMYCGPKRGEYIDNSIELTPAQFSNLSLATSLPAAENGTSYCAVTAFNESGGESDFSNELMVYMEGGVPKRITPLAPIDLRKGA